MPAASTNTKSVRRLNWYQRSRRFGLSGCFVLTTW